MGIIREKSISRKLVIIFMYTSLITLVTHMITYANLHQVITKLDSAYASNSNLSELSASINDVQSNMYNYLNVKSTDSLENYYMSVQNLENKLKLLNDKYTDYGNSMMETHILKMAENYINKTGQTVQAKRGRNIKQYNAYYDEASCLKEYISTYIESLNDIKFKENSTNYLLVRQSLSSLEIVSTGILIAIIGFNIFVLIVISRQVTRPLINLTSTADQIAQGDFETDLLEVHTGDEVEVLSRAFNKMIVSIREYIEKLREQMIIESRMKENELMMENYLKDAKLKYLQAQINPHFLFNTLNAGMQLAMIEGAEQTSIFIDNMAEFFRYSITRMDYEVTLSEELRLVDHYLYILSVRFGDEVQYEKKVDKACTQLMVPSMIIQPLVENSFQYGIRDIEWQGKIMLKVYEEDERIYIEVSDNGKGMTQEKIADVMAGKAKTERNDKTSNGIGIGNVMSRLQLFYGIEDVMEITSPGIDQGTTVTLKLPMLAKREGGVANV